MMQESPLGYENGRYFVDYDRLEHDLSNPQTSLMIFCNPHNPCGIIWTKDELAKIGALCRKYNVTVISERYTATSQHREIIRAVCGSIRGLRRYKHHLYCSDQVL